MRANSTIISQSQGKATIQVLAAHHYYEGNYREIAHLLKQSDEQVIQQAAYARHYAASCFPILNVLGHRPFV